MIHIFFVKFDSLRSIPKTSEDKKVFGEIDLVSTKIYCTGVKRGKKEQKLYFGTFFKTLSRS